RLKHPSEVLKKGDEVQAMVLNIDAENQRLPLGLKQLQTDVWDEFFSQHNVGDTVEGKVVRLTNFGALVELAEGIEGLIHVSEFDRYLAFTVLLSLSTSATWASYSSHSIEPSPSSVRFPARSSIARTYSSNQTHGTASTNERGCNRPIFPMIDARAGRRPHT